MTDGNAVNKKNKAEPMIFHQNNQFFNQKLLFSMVVCVSVCCGFSFDFSDVFSSFVLFFFVWIQKKHLMSWIWYFVCFFFWWNHSFLCVSLSGVGTNTNMYSKIWANKQTAENPLGAIVFHMIRFPFEHLLFGFFPLFLALSKVNNYFDDFRLHGSCFLFVSTFVRIFFATWSCFICWNLDNTKRLRFY